MILVLEIYFFRWKTRKINGKYIDSLRCVQVLLLLLFIYYHKGFRAERAGYKIRSSNYIKNLKHSIERNLKLSFN